MDLDYLIDRLEELLDRSTRIPGTSRVIINEDEYLRLIDQMRISVPQEIKNARRIEAERDALLATAQEQAEAMIAKADERADELVSEHSVLQQAQQRSDEVLREAYDEAEVIRADADNYALEVLERIAAQVQSFGRTIDNGIRVLREGRLDAGAGADDVEPEIVGGSGSAADKPRG
jgi:vacuolar-type H+-ATPase subunit H